jgi:hypothetical protein
MQPPSYPAVEAEGEAQSFTERLSRRERRNRKFAERGAAAKERLRHETPAQKAERDAAWEAYTASEQYDADQREGREAVAQYEFERRAKAASVKRASRAGTGARGAERPAGQGGARRASSDGDGDGDPDLDEPEPAPARGGGPLTAARRAA